MAPTTWTALGDPTRRAILDRIRRRPCAVGELSAHLGLGQPQTSKHLKVLREAHLVTVRVDAQRRVYSLDPRGFSDIDDWLAPYRSLWNGSLDALGRHLDAAAQHDSRTET